MLFFVFKQKTAYEMRISDWSSDVCSSDLSGMTQHIYLPSSTSGVNKTSLAVYRQDIEAGNPGNKSLTWNGLQSQTSGTAVSIRSVGLDRKSVVRERVSQYV